MASLLTAVVTGLVIFIGSQYLLKLVLEPVVELRRTIGKIGNVLSVYHYVITVPERHEIRRKEVTEKIEQLSGSLFETVLAIPAYHYIHCIFSLPSKNDVLDVADKLQSISGISQSGAKWTLEKNWLLTIEVFELLRAPIPKPIQYNKAKLAQTITNKRSSA